MKKKPEPDSDLILYLTEDGRTRLQVRLEGETVLQNLQQLPPTGRPTRSNSTTWTSSFPWATA